MSKTIRGLSLPLLAVLLAVAGAAAPTFAQDAMAPAADAMAPAADAMAPMTPMTEDDFKLCMTQAGGITFPDVMKMAEAGCTAMHDGKMMDAMGAMDAMAPAADAMAPAADAMAPAADAMAPAADAMAPAK